MTMSGPAGGALPRAQTAGGSGKWLVLTASERGAAHVAVRAPNQDSVAFERAGADGVVTAVADGHGHSRHLRSARGSRLAVGIGCRVGQEFADLLAGGPDMLAGQIAGLATSFLVPTVVARWRDAVLADVEAEPFSDAEQGRRRRGDDPTIAYGSTLLLCVTLGDWLVLAQIGDGDVVGVLTDGTAARPVPDDPQLDGLATTSLCGPDPVADFRVAIVNTSRTPLLAALLATDGYGNAQVVEEWPSSFSQDLAWLLREHDMRWLASQLPTWAARCASSDGSADDTTVALLISPAGQTAHGATRPDGFDPGSDEITIPAAPLEVTTEQMRTDEITAGSEPPESSIP